MEIDDLVSAFIEGIVAFHSSLCRSKHFLGSKCTFNNMKRRKLI